MAEREMRRRHDPLVISCAVVCLLCLVVTLLVSGTVLHTKDRVDETTCAQLRSFRIGQERERRLARTDDPVNRSAHRQSIRAFAVLIEDIEPLVDCPGKAP
jgi:hypothetical protein